MADLFVSVINKLFKMCQKLVNYLSWSYSIEIMTLYRQKISSESIIRVLRANILKTFAIFFGKKVSASFFHITAHSSDHHHVVQQASSFWPYMVVRGAPGGHHAQKLTFLNPAPGFLYVFQDKSRPFLTIYCIYRTQIRQFLGYLCIFSIRLVTMIKKQTVTDKIFNFLAKNLNFKSKNPRKS